MLVTKGESVWVVGTAKKPGNGYVGPAPVTTTTKPKPTTSVPKKHKPAKGTTSTTKPPAHTPTTPPTTPKTTPKTTPTTTPHPKTTTSHPKG